MNPGSNESAAVLNANLAALSNAIAMGCQALLGVAGNDVANAIGNQPINAPYLQEALAARLQVELSKKGY